MSRKSEGLPVPAAGNDLNLNLCLSVVGTSIMPKNLPVMFCIVLGEYFFQPNASSSPSVKTGRHSQKLNCLERSTPSNEGCTGILEPPGKPTVPEPLAAL